MCNVLGGNVGKIIYLILGFLSISLSAAPFESPVGTYESEDKLSCNLEIKLFQKKDRNYYEVKIDKRLLTGEYTFKDQYVIFEGLEAFQAAEGINWKVSALAKRGELLFQNYGNSINPYKLFSECRGKYLILNKVDK